MHGTYKYYLSGAWYDTTREQLVEWLSRGALPAETWVLPPGASEPIAASELPRWEASVAPPPVLPARQATAMAAGRSASARLSRRPLVKVFLLALVAAGGLFVITRMRSDGPPRPEAEAITPAPSSVIRSQDPKGAPVARTIAAYQDIARADDEHVADAVLAGGVVMIENGTLCAALESGPGYVRIRLLSGEHRGLTGYVSEASVSSSEDFPLADVPAAQAPPSNRPCVFDVPGSGAGVPLAITKPAYDQFLKFARAEDYMGMGELLASGSVVMIPNGTECLRVGGGIGYLEVRVMGGEHFGLLGYASRNTIRH